MVVGITGKYCAGKSTLANILKNQGYSLLNVDELGHQALISRKEQIIEVFGNSILDENNIISRKKLASIVFSSKKKLLELEAITHPWIIERARDIIESKSEEDWVIDAALLHYMKLNNLCDTIILVHSSFLRRFFRAMKRDNINARQVIQRFRKQKNVPSKYSALYNSLPNFFRKKKFNKSQFYSDHLVIGTYSLTVLEHRLHKILQGARYGTSFTHK